MITKYISYHKNKKIDVLKTFWNLSKTEHPILKEISNKLNISISPYQFLRKSKEIRKILSEEVLK